MTPAHTARVLRKSGEHARDIANHYFTKRGSTDPVTVIISSIGALLTRAGEHCEAIANEGNDQP